jgi:hypothetical protein
MGLWGKTSFEKRGGKANMQFVKTQTVKSVEAAVKNLGLRGLKFHRI